MDLGRRIARNEEHRYIGSSLVIRALLSALLLLTSSLAAQAANNIAQTLQRLDSPVIVDVRSEGEYASGAIDGALNHPVQGLPGTLLDTGVELDEEIIVYCRRDAVRAKQRPCSSKAAFSWFLMAGL